MTPSKMANSHIQKSHSIFWKRKRESATLTEDWISGLELTVFMLVEAQPYEYVYFVGGSH